MLSDGAYTVLYLQRASRDEILSLLYMATALMPTDKPPTCLGKTWSCYTRLNLKAPPAVSETGTTKKTSCNA